MKRRFFSELDREPHLDATMFIVQVDDNNVILKGYVFTEYERSLARSKAERAMEDHKVINEVIVDPYHKRSDTEIGIACQRKF